MSLYSYEYQKKQIPTFNHDHRIRKILIHAAASLGSLFIVLLTTLLINNDQYSPKPVS